jgi:hypothetical protein
MCFVIKRISTTISDCLASGDPISGTDYYAELGGEIRASNQLPVRLLAASLRLRSGLTPA